MSEKTIKLLPKVLCFEHKCKQTKCKQMSEEFENMKKFVLYSDQLNAYYKNHIIKTESCSQSDNQTEFVSEKTQILRTIESEIKKIEETLRLFLKDCDKNIDLKKSAKTQCDLCWKQLSPKLLPIHLNRHLDNIFGQKSLKDKTSDTSFEGEVDGEHNSYSEPLFSLEIKEEPKEESDDNYSTFSGDFDGMANNFSDEEEVTEKKCLKNKVKTERTEPQSREKFSPPKRRRKTREYPDNFATICDECGKTCKNGRHLSQHLSRVHKISKKTSNNCHLCDFGNVSIEELKTHFADEHNLTVNKWNFHCTWTDCKQVFRFRTALDKHMRTHTGDLLYKCEWPGCAIQFNKQWKIVEHMRKHTGEKPFVCHWPGCDKAFGNRASYRGHVLSHNKEKHICYYPGCDKSYPFKSMLEEHVLNTHRKEEKPFICRAEGCGRAFATNHNLKLHLVIHEDRPRYECPREGCERSFVEEKSLQKHLEKPHGKVKRLSNGRQLYREYKCDWPGCEFEANISTNLRIHKMRAHTGEKPEKCTYPGCSFAAVRKFELKVHMMKHTGESPYPCAFPNCGRRFKSQRALDTHINKSHPNERF